MDDKKNNYALYALVFLTFLVLYIYKSYSVLFERDYGFIYHPTTGQVYELELAPTLSGISNWDLLSPSKKIHFSQIVYAEAVGNIESLKRDNDKFPSLDRNNQLDEISSKIYNKISNFDVENLTFLEIDYYPRKDISESSLIPSYLNELKKHTGKIPADILVVDAVINKWDTKDEKNNITILEQALFIKGRAADDISSKILLTRPSNLRGYNSPQNNTEF